jgi:hypothetical protein
MNQSQKAYYQQLFESETTYATTMVVALTDVLGHLDWLNWEPESIKLEIATRFNARISEENLDKIMGLALALTTNQFYVSLEAFIYICNALAGDGASFDTFDPADVEEMCWAVTEVLLNDETQSLPLDQVFSQEIRYYIGATAGYEGYKELPKPLTFGELDPEYGTATEVIPDEAMFSAYYDRSKQMVKDVQDETQEKLRNMVTQVSELPLRRGDSESWKKFSGRGLSETQKQPSRAEEGRHRAPSLQ